MNASEANAPDANGTDEFVDDAAQCTFPDTTDCTGEHYCDECGTHLAASGECPKGCDPEAGI